MTAPTSFVIVGHVDHGKSTFTGRLLYDTENLPADRVAEIRKASDVQGRRMEFAFVTDQFHEEREQNVTMDTTQTFFRIDGRPFVIVDAPGHKEYLKHMITGATQARHGILMLDVNEGIREGTDKHARILNLLGIRQVVVMVNKMDTVDFSEDAFRRLETEISGRLRALGMTAAAIIPMSAYEGDNVATRSRRMPWYAGPTALDFIQACAAPPSAALPAALRMPVQLVYDFEGRRLLLGRVEQGRLAQGQTVSVFPRRAKAEIRAILKFHEKISGAGAGECVAIELDSATGFQRGDVLTDAPAPEAVDLVSVHAFWAASEALKAGDQLLVECRTQSAPFDVVSISDEMGGAGAPPAALSGGDVGFLVLRSRGSILIDVGPEDAPMSRLVFYRNGQVVGCGVAARAA